VIGIGQRPTERQIDQRNDRHRDRPGQHGVTRALRRIGDKGRARDGADHRCRVELDRNRSGRGQQRAAQRPDQARAAARAFAPRRTRPRRLRRT